jgi:hypothetical protein
MSMTTFASREIFLYLDRDSGPLILCVEFKLVEKNWMKLIELIDLKCGLLDELFSVRYINDLQMKSIKPERNDTEQITSLHVTHVVP